jgi:WD40 repeat protein
LIDFLNQALKSATQRPLFANSGGQILLTGTGAESVNPVLAGICPYKGLTYFDCNEEDPKYFYGRTALTDQLLEKVRQGNFLAVLGASGSGKSSVVRAGLLHQLKLGQRLSGSDGWQLYIFRPGEHPLKRLAEVFVESGLSAIDRATQLAKAEELIGTGDVGLGHLITAVEASRVVLVVDQFEEVFTLCQDKTERQQFFECLLKAGEREDNKLCLVVTMRADFFGKCAEYGELASQIQQHLVTVTPMTPEELEQAITEPAKKVGLEVERELVTEMMADVQGSPGSLPLLQYTLTELWKQRTVERLTLSAYTRLGGVKGTLQKRANEVYESLSPEEQQTAKRIFLELTQLGEGTEDTRRQVKKRDLVSTEQSQALVDRVIQTLADAKLVVTSTLVEKGLSSEPVAVVDVAHEALIRHWGRLRQWLTENRNALRQKRSIETDAQEWLDKDKARDYLLQGLKLAEAEDFLQRGSENVSLSSLAQDYVEVSKKEHDHIRQVEEERRQRELEQERKARKAAQMRNRVAAISILVLAGLTTFAFDQARKAEREKIATQTQTSKALYLAGQELEALVEAIRAGKLLKKATLTTTTVLNPTTMALFQAVYEVRESNRLTGHSADIYDVSFSPDSKTIATGSDYGNIKLWNLEGEELKIDLMSHNATVADISFSPDGRSIISGYSDGNTKLWNLKGEELESISRHSNGVTSVSFSPDGKIIASVSDKTIKLWNRNPGFSEITINSSSSDAFLGLSFSPDGKTIASASGEGIKLWSLENQLPTLTVPIESASVSATKVSFSSDHKTIAFGDGDTIKLWNLNGQKLKTLVGHSDYVTSVSFSPNGKTIASASNDHTVKVWDMYGQLLKTFTGHIAPVIGVSFSPDGKTIASASYDSTIKLWTLEGKELQTFTYQPDPDNNLFNSFSFSPDSQSLAVGMADNTIKLWSLNGKLINTFTGHNGSVTSVSFSPDGKTIVSASRDRTIKLWNLEGQKLKTLTRHNGVIADVSFSPDGKFIASADTNDGIKLWYRDGRLLKNIGGGFIFSFSPDGKMIALSGYETIVLNLELDDLLSRGCDWLRDYLKNPNNGMSQDDDRRTICDDVKPSAKLVVQQGAGLAQQRDNKGAIAAYKKAQKLSLTR